MKCCPGMENRQKRAKRSSTSTQIRDVDGRVHELGRALTAALAQRGRPVVPAVGGVPEAPPKSA